jgi:hypothetical protein
MMRLFAFLFLISTSTLWGQTAAELDLILETREVSFAQASRFVLVSAGTADEGTEAGTVYALAGEKGWLPKRASPDAAIRLGELCALVMKAFDLRGSFLYALFPGPHYAFRELDYLRLIPGRRDPGVKVSGERFLQILDMVSSHAERNR